VRRHLTVALVIVAAAASAGCKKKSAAKPADAAVAVGVADDAAAAAPDAAPAPKPPGVAADGSGGALPAEATGPHIIPPQKFRHSSVRGDFRIYVTASGLVTSWKTVLSARKLDGTPLWKKDGLGRAVAVSADGKRIVANNDAGDIAVLDAATGEPVAAPARLGGRDDPASSGIYVSAFAWTPDGQHIIAVDSKHVFLLKPDGTMDRELPVCADGNCYFSSAIALSNDELLLNEANDSSKGLQRRKLADGAIVATGTFQGSDVVVSPDGKRLLVDGYPGLAMFDATTLAQVWQAPLPGFKGLAFEATATSASIQFKSMPKLSPDGAYIAVNDQAGQLWLLSAADGKPVVAYPEDVIRFVEDVTWLDGGTLLVIDNAGHVARLAGTPPKLVWSQDDAPEPERWDEP
jgi:outer membrane protein assembly factor BamB